MLLNNYIKYSILKLSRYAQVPHDPLRDLNPHFEKCCTRCGKIVLLDSIDAIVYKKNKTDATILGQQHANKCMHCDVCRLSVEQTQI